jgi:hypothetical protein
MACEAGGVRAIWVIMSNYFKLLDTAVGNTRNTLHAHAEFPCRFLLLPCQTHHWSYIWITIQFTQAEQVAK